jgi:uncharacterized cupin superfamily protein
MSATIYLFGSKTIPAEHYQAAPERLISGNPQLTVWQHYTDPTGQFSVGEWQGEVGTWRVQYTEEEFCQIIEGVSTITGEDGTALTVRSGDRFVIPAGFQGTWQVLERTRKTYVIFERKA